MVNNVDMKKWWNCYTGIKNIGNKYNDINTINQYIEEFEQYIPSSQFNKVLDLDSGNGLETRLLKQKGYYVVGITANKDNLKIAKEQYDVDLIEMDINILDFPQNSFDAIFLIQTFENFINPFIANIEMRRILKDDGRIYFDILDHYNISDNDNIYLNLSNSDQINRIFKMCGFKEIEDFNISHRLRFMFEKLSDDKLENKLNDKLKSLIDTRNNLDKENDNEKGSVTIANIIESPKTEPDIESDEILQYLSNIEDETERFVEETYLKILGRKADPGGKRDYVKAIKDGRIHRDYLQSIFLNSVEYKNKTKSNNKKVDEGW